MNNGRNQELPAFRKAIDIGMTTVGLLLFVFLGARAIQQIGDRKIAAGQNKQAVNATASSGPLWHRTGTSDILQLTSETNRNTIITSPQYTDQTTKSDKPKQENESSERMVTKDVPAIEHKPLKVKVNL